jgi:hypothetical protein
MNRPIVVRLRTPFEIKRLKTSSQAARSTAHSRCACDRVTLRPGISAYSASTCSISVRVVALRGLTSVRRSVTTTRSFAPSAFSPTHAIRISQNLLPSYPLDSILGERTLDGREIGSIATVLQQRGQLRPLDDAPLDT